MKIYTYYCRFYDISRKDNPVSAHGFVAGKDFADAAQNVASFYGANAMEDVRLMLTVDGDSGYLEAGEAMEQSNEWWQRMEQA